MSFRDEEYRRQESFRQRSATISSHGKAPVDEPARRYDYMLALGYEDENLYPSLRGAQGVRRFFDDRGVKWWRHCGFEATAENGPTRNMACSQIACVNFVLPLAEIEDGLLAVLAAIDDDVTDIATIEDPTAGTSSPVEFEWIGLGHALEGEAETRRGEFSTGVDAFLVAETRMGRRAYLLEWKYAESYGENDKGRGRKGRTRRRRYTGIHTRRRRRSATEFPWTPGSTNRSTSSCASGSWRIEWLRVGSWACPWRRSCWSFPKGMPGMPQLQPLVLIAQPRTQARWKPHPLRRPARAGLHVGQVRMVVPCTIASLTRVGVLCHFAVA